MGLQLRHPFQDRRGVASAPSSKPHTSVTDPWSVTDYARVKLSPPTEHWPVIGRNSRGCSLPMNSRSNASEEKSFVV